MGRLAALFVRMAALITISTIAEAADGCGQCVPQDDPGHEYRSDYGPPVVHGPQLRLGFDRRDEARYSPPNPAFKTWNNCPPNYTVQDGLCKPYTGR
jgi:hypothetical protein